MAKANDAAKTPAAKAAATKPAAKPATERKPRQPRKPKPEQPQASGSQSTVGKMLNEVAGAASASRTSMAAALVGASVETGPGATQPKADATGRSRLTPEQAMLQTGMGEINPKSETEALTNLHETETAKLIVGQKLDDLRTHQLARNSAFAPKHYHHHSQEKRLVQWARHFGVPLTAMIWLNGDVVAVTSEFDFHEHYGLKFPQHAQPFDWEVYNPYAPESYGDYSGVLIQPIDFNHVTKLRLAAEREYNLGQLQNLGDRLRAWHPGPKSYARGDVLRSLIDPNQYIIVLETPSDKETNQYFDGSRSRGYGGRSSYLNEPEPDLLAVQAHYMVEHPGEEGQCTSFGSQPRYYHSTMFELVHRAQPAK